MTRLLNHITSIYITNRTYWSFGLCFVVMIFGALHAIIFFLSVLLLVSLFLGLLLDYYTLFYTNGRIELKRRHEDLLSLGDVNPIQLEVTSTLGFPIALNIFDEVPYQLQLRGFKVTTFVEADTSKYLTYDVEPNVRGMYRFGNINGFVSTRRFGLLERRFICNQEKVVPVYPSLIHMRAIELISLSKIAINQGVKKMRRVGHSYEFEQIKQYVVGDDFRSINWKATARSQQLMINQYEDERSQPIYFAIDKGRNMRMPFNNLSLVDYAVNTTLAISNVALQKSDRVGLITFDNQLEAFVKAEQRRGQLSYILESLFKLIQTDLDPSFHVLYHTLKNQVRQRSLIFLFTNINTLHSLERVKPILRLIAQKHLLVVVLFENSEIAEMVEGKEARSLEEIYQMTIAEKFIYEQKLIASELNSIGVQTIISKPEDLSIQSVNKYLELKSKGLI